MGRVSLRIFEFSCGLKYWDRSEKLAFMDKHGIDISVVRCSFRFLDCSHVLAIEVVYLTLFVPSWPVAPPIQLCEPVVGFPVSVRSE